MRPALSGRKEEQFAVHRNGFCWVCHDHYFASDLPVCSTSAGCSKAQSLSYGLSAFGILFHEHCVFHYDQWMVS